MKKRVVLEKRSLKENEISVHEVMEDLLKYSIFVEEENCSMNLYVSQNNGLWLCNYTDKPKICSIKKWEHIFDKFETLEYFADDKKIVFPECEDDTIHIDEVDFEKHRITAVYDSDVTGIFNYILCKELCVGYYRWIKDCKFILETNETKKLKDAIKSVFDFEWVVYAEERN